MPACEPEFSRLAVSNAELVASGAPTKRRLHQPSLFTALRRSFSFSLMPEKRAVSPERHPSLSRFLRFVTWALLQLLRPFFALFSIVSLPGWKQSLIVLPSICMSVSLFIFWQCIQWSTEGLKTIGRFISLKNTKQPLTVLISGGSSVQALHLARNLHSVGARVVAFETAGKFALLKYSTAVDKFYTMPRPNPVDPLAYARALREIVQREEVVFYVPVSSSTSAYYDALAKPHLEVIGCQCFVPCAWDVIMLDDPLELMTICRAAGLATPQFWVVANDDDVRAWYDSGASNEGKHFIASAGALGAPDRLRFIMPEDKHQFRFPRATNAEKLWVIIREPKGERILTCTTLNESRVVNNVICRVDAAQKRLVPQKDDEIHEWVKRFLFYLAPARPMTGHVSFRLIREEASNGQTNRLVAIGARVGVSLSYLCQNSSSRSFGSQFSRITVGNTALDTREALFAFWDPIPYYAYYQLHTPRGRRSPARRRRKYHIEAGHVRNNS